MTVYFHTGDKVLIKNDAKSFVDKYGHKHVFGSAREAMKGKVYTIGWAVVFENCQLYAFNEEPELLFHEEWLELLEREKKISIKSISEDEIIRLLSGGII